MADNKQRVKRLLLDLTSLEINTLVTENITGESMGDPRQAIAQIQALYAAKLDEIDDAHRGAETAASPGGQAAPAAQLPASPAAARAQVRDTERRAESLKQQHQDKLSSEDHSHLSNIRDRSRELKGLLGKLGGAATPAAAAAQIQRAPGGPEPAASGDSAPAETPELEPEDMVTLRKMWELGVEPIAAQTVVQIGGDVITRVHPKYASGEHPMLLELHQAGVSTATGMWNTLIDTAVRILGKIFER